MKVKKNVVEKSWRILTKRGMMYLVYAESAAAAAKKYEFLLKDGDEIAEVSEYIWEGGSDEE